MVHQFRFAEDAEPQQPAPAPVSEWLPREWTHRASTQTPVGLAEVIEIQPGVTWTPAAPVAIEHEQAGRGTRVVTLPRIPAPWRSRYLHEHRRQLLLAAGAALAIAAVPVLGHRVGDLVGGGQPSQVLHGGAVAPVIPSPAPHHAKPAPTHILRLPVKAQPAVAARPAATAAAPVTGSSTAQATVTRSSSGTSSSAPVSQHPVPSAPAPSVPSRPSSGGGGASSGPGLSVSTTGSGGGGSSSSQTSAPQTQPTSSGQSSSTPTSGNGSQGGSSSPVSAVTGVVSGGGKALALK